MKLRKIIRPILLILILIVLSSCSNGKPYISKTYNINETIMVENESEINDDTYIIFMYDSKCSSCINILENINKFIKNESLTIYTIDNYNDSPIIYIKNGSKTIKTIKKANTLLKYERLSYEIKKCLKIRNIYKVNNYNDLKELINKNSTIYYSLGNCIDCAKFEELYFNEFLIKNDKTIYNYDINDYPKDLMEYQAFKDEIGLSNKNNPLGYKNGFVPCIIKYSDNNVSNYKVIFNDEFYTNPETNNITIIGSYYSNNPYLNKEFKTIDSYYKKLIKFYSKEVESLINE